MQEHFNLFANTEPTNLYQNNFSDKDIILWAESPDEARSFLRRCKAAGIDLGINKIFVAKRSGKFRSNGYVLGEYFRTSDDEDVDVYEGRPVASPEGIRELVQWCTCDIMISRGNEPVVVLEDTTHIVRMNLYQRLPRLAKAAMLRVPSLVLQGTRGVDFNLRGDRWALYRYLSAFERIAKANSLSPSLPIYYLPNENAEAVAQKFVLEHISALLNADDNKVASDRKAVLDSINDILKNGLFGNPEIAPDIPSISHSGVEVIVRIGARPERPSWRTKGSGQMDPYIGMLVAAKYLYCYDSEGVQVKPLVIEFAYLPTDFFFFKDWEKSNSLYKRLPFEIADEIRFCG